MSIIERKPFKKLLYCTGTACIAYVKKETHLKVYELGFVFCKLWSLDSPGNFYATFKTERKPKYIKQFF